MTLHMTQAPNHALREQGDLKYLSAFFIHTQELMISRGGHCKEFTGTWVTVSRIMSRREGHQFQIFQRWKGHSYKYHILHIQHTTVRALSQFGGPPAVTDRASVQRKFLSLHQPDVTLTSSLTASSRRGYGLGFCLWN